MDPKAGVDSSMIEPYYGDNEQMTYGNIFIVYRNRKSTINVMLNKLLGKPTIYNMSQSAASLGKDPIARWLRKMMRPGKEDFVLDIGCGTGKYSEVFQCNYFGIDISPEYIDYARKYYKGNFSVMDATCIEFSDKMFDYVMIVGVLHHLPDDKVAGIIGEINRICKRNGRIIIMEPVYPTSKLNMVGYLLRRLDRGKYIRTPEQLVGMFSGTFPSSHYTIERYFMEKYFPLELILLSATNQR